MSAVLICWCDFIVQTRFPAIDQPRYEDLSWWERVLDWTVPPPGQRGLWFALDTSVAILGAAVLFYVLFTRWERKRSAKRAA